MKTNNEPKVRRFESGGIETMINQALAGAGLGEIKFSCARNGGKPFVVDKKRYSFDELVELVDGLRTKKGLEPLRPRGNKPRRFNRMAGKNPLTC